jgi:hypothetical protein
MKRILIGAVVGIVIIIAIDIALGIFVGFSLLSCVVLALLAVALIYLALVLPKFTKTKMYSIEGQLMIEMKEMIADERGIGIKATLMGAMPATIYVRPAELWNLLSQVTPHVLVSIVNLLAVPPKDLKE